MKRYWPFIAIVVIATAIVFALYITTPKSEESPPMQPYPEQQLANPASVYCEQQGYRNEIRTAADGSQTGYCIFPNGNECEEWAYYRGECSP